jgi:hypothetical protein
MKNRCLYCGRETPATPYSVCSPPDGAELNMDRAQLAKLGVQGIDWRKDREAQETLKMMMTNKMEGKVP